MSRCRCARCCGLAGVGFASIGCDGPKMHKYRWLVISPQPSGVVCSFEGAAGLVGGAGAFFRIRWPRDEAVVLPASIK